MESLGAAVLPIYRHQLATPLVTAALITAGFGLILYMSCRRRPVHPNVDQLAPQRGSTYLVAGVMETLNENYWIVAASLTFSGVFSLLLYTYLHLMV